MLPVELVKLALRRRTLHRVRGSSMEPTLSDGDLLLVDPRAFSNRPPRPGEIIVARHPYREVHMVKRVATITCTGRIRVIGDNPEDSTDSRAWGSVGPDRILGRVTARVR